MTDPEPSSRAGAPSPAIPSRPNSAVAAVLLEIPWECLALVLLLAISLCTGLSLAVHALWTRYSDHGSRAAAEPRLSSSGDFRSYAAATDAVQCASVTRFIFERNGSVADAAIATFLCACVVLPHAVGLGGGFIALIYDRKDNATHVLDAREVAPLAARPDMFIQNTDEALVGGRAVAVPGVVHGLGELHRRFGRLPWAELFTPAVNLARFGFPVGPELAAALVGARSMFETNLRARAHFWNEVSNMPYREGETLKQPLLADTLEAISNDSAGAFYNGKIARVLVRDLRSIGGILTQRDLRTYTSKWRAPVESELVDGSRLQSAPAPSSGPVLLYAAALLNRMHAPHSQELLFHRMVESFKYAYAKFNELSDEDFANLSASMRSITSVEHVRRTLSLIDDQRTYDDPRHYGLHRLGRMQHGSSHFAFLGAAGDAVSMTGSLGEHFGARCVSPTLGVVLNNHMSEFTLPRPPMPGYQPNENNYIEPGKRPVTAMAPGLLVDRRGDVQLVIGASGGARIVSSAASVIHNIVRRDMSVEEAVEAPRLHHQLLPNVVVYEQHFSEEVLESLRRRGHVVRPMERRPAAVNAIARAQDRVIYAVADFRKGGIVDGY
ncbi:scoloptoxin SSD14-like [Dermacentor variabilis]|uniref:scoloptoxin SSD14-like n=1 Tax=Dermacentor variabilis TaxID=34621 RepID=UPI003F5C3CCC